MHSKAQKKKREDLIVKPLESKKLISILGEKQEDLNSISREENMILELNRMLKQNKGIIPPSLLGKFD